MEAVDLILYPATLLELFYFLNFLIDSPGFSSYAIISSANRDSFTSYFPVIAPVFSHLMALASASTLILNSSGESAHPYLASDLGEKPVVFLRLVKQSP